MWVNRLPGAPLLCVMPKEIPKLQDPHPRQLFSPDYCSCWEGKLPTLLQLLRSCSSALEHPLPQARVSAPGPQEEALCCLPGWACQPDLWLGAGMGPVPGCGA